MTTGMMGALVLWGLIGTTAMTSMLLVGQAFGLSRMSPTFLLGSAISGNRARATVLGFAIYLLGGWGFAFLYYALFRGLGLATWWIGILLGLVHGVFLLVCAMPILPYLHPRMASEHHGVTKIRLLEPPGFCGLNYGYQTPLVLLVAQAVYGGVLGGGVQIQHMMVHG